MEIQRRIMVNVICIICLLVGCAAGLFAEEGRDWIWADIAEGPSHAEGTDITTDSQGNSYVVGSFRETITFGDIELQSEDNYDIFAAKMCSDGEWVWALRAGGEETCEGYGIAVDEDGNSYITGGFREKAFFGDYVLESSGLTDIFIAKISDEGSWLWADRAGGSSNITGTGIVVDNLGNCYVTGNFRDTAHFGEEAKNRIHSEGGSSIFIAKYNNEGKWKWARSGGGTADCESFDIALGNYGDIIITGTYRDEADFGGWKLEPFGFRDIFVAKTDDQGDWLWSARAGGESRCEAKSLAVNNKGDIYVTGMFSRNAIFGDNVIEPKSSLDIFIAKIDSEGEWQWVNRAGNNSRNKSFGVDVDAQGNAYVTGKFIGNADFGDTDLRSGPNIFDIFIAKAGKEGDWEWALQSRGSHHDEAYAIAVDAHGNCYLTGAMMVSVDFGNIRLEGEGQTDVFVAKLGFKDTFIDDDYKVADLTGKVSFNQNYPNPFNPSTTIGFYVEEEVHVHLAVYDVKGRLIKTLEDRVMQGGEHRVAWNGKDKTGREVSSGVYLAKIVTHCNEMEVLKMMLMK